MSHKKKHNKLWRWWRKYQTDRLLTGMWIGFLVWSIYGFVSDFRDGLYVVVLLVLPLIVKLSYHVENDKVGK